MKQVNSSRERNVYLIKLNIMKTVLIFISALLFAFIGQSCWGVNDFYEVIVIQEIYLHNLVEQKTDSNTVFKREFESQELILNDSSRFCFEMTYLDSVLTTYYANYGPPVAQSVIASSPDHFVELNSNIDSVLVFSVYDFDDKVKSGDDISEYMTFTRRQFLYPEEFSLSEVEPRLIEYFSGFYGSDPPIFYLNKSPISQDTVSFLMKVTFKDGSFVQARTDDVIIR